MAVAQALDDDARTGQGVAQMVEQRLDTAKRFAELIDANPHFILLQDPDLVAVTFLYLPTDVDPTEPDIGRINQANRWIHSRIIDEGTWHLHQFSILDDTGRLRRGATLYPLRFMAGNPRIEESHMVQPLDYVTALGRRYGREAR